MNRLYSMLLVLGFCCFVVLASTAGAVADPVVTLSATQASATSTVTLSATASGFSTTPNYAFWAQAGTGAWQVLQGNTSNSTYVWAPDIAATKFMVVVTDGSGTPISMAQASLMSVIPGAPSNPGIQLAPSAPTQNSPATLTASATGSGTLQYAFATLYTGGGATTWQIVQNFGASTTCTWTPANSGAYTVMALIRTSSTPAGENPVVTATTTCTVAASTFTGGSLSVAKYQGDKPAAITYEWDDGIWCQAIIVEPIFKQLGLHTTFNIVAGWTVEKNDYTDIGRPGDWAAWRTVLADGNEIANHTYDHTDLTTITDPNVLDSEINGAYDVITNHLGVSPLTFVYPYNDWNATVTAVVNQRHIWSRQTINEFDATNFTVAYANGVLDNTITQKTWIVVFGHGVDGHGYSPFSSAALKTHLQYAVTRPIWIDTAANVFRYITEQAAAKTTLVSAAAQTYTFSVQCPSLATATYNVPLTVRYSTGSVTPKTVTALQGTKSVPCSIEAGYILVNVVPGSGNVTVTYQ